MTEWIANSLASLFCQMLSIIALWHHTEMKLGSIVLGIYTGDISTELMPIMAHPPNFYSDLSLVSFLNTIINVSTIFSPL
jgi:hypothetical protein